MFLQIHYQDSTQEIVKANTFLHEKKVSNNLWPGILFEDRKASFLYGFLCCCKEANLRLVI